jgi:hypothetical protein
MSVKITDIDTYVEDENKPIISTSVIPFPNIVYQGPVAEVHEIKIKHGWNIISTFLNSSSLDFTSIASLIFNFNTTQNGGVALTYSDYSNPNPDKPYILIAKDYQGNAFLPEFNFDGIGNFVDGQGYQLKMIHPDGPGAEETLTLQGTKQEYDNAGLLQNLTFSLPAGWSIIAMPLYFQADPAVIFEELVKDNKVIILKDNNGLVYLPEYGYNGMGNMKAGQGYQVKLTEASDITFRPSAARGMVIVPGIRQDLPAIEISAPPVNTPEETESIFNIYINPDILRTFFNSFGIDIQIQEIQQNILNEYLEVILSEPELYIIYKKQGAGGIFEYLPILIANEDLFSQYPWYARDAINLMYTAYKNILYGKEFINFKKDALIIERPFLLEVRDSSNNVIGYSDIIQRQTGPLPEFQDYLDVAIPVGFTSATTCSFFLYDEFAQQHFPLKTDPVAITSEVNGIFILNSLSLQNGVEYKKD